MEKFTLSAYHKIIWQHTIWLLSNRWKFWEWRQKQEQQFLRFVALSSFGVKWGFSVCVRTATQLQLDKKLPKAAFNVNTDSRWTTGGVIHILLSGLWCAPLSCRQQELVFRVAQIICVNRYTLLNVSSWINLFTKFVKINKYKKNLIYMYVYLDFKL